MHALTLFDCLCSRRSLTNRGITFIQSDAVEVFLSYAELYDRARGVLYDLQRHGLKKGDELVFQVEDSEPFLCLFWACILGGIVPVPSSVGNNEEHKRKLFKIWGVLSSPYLISDRSTMERLGEMSALDPSLSAGYDAMKEHSLLLEELIYDGGLGQLHPPEPEHLAFIQFTSGSTSDPKGVMLTHQNLVSNLQDINERNETREGDSSIFWMPLTHDMGLIFCHMSALMAGIDQYTMQTWLFIRRPTLWMKKVCDHKISIISSPNFGLKYFLQAYEKEGGNKPWDLSHVRILYNGAEPISYNLSTYFIDEMGKYGFPQKAFAACYGMAEASVAVSVERCRDEFISYDVDRSHLNIKDHVRFVSRNAPNAVNFVRCGMPLRSTSLRVTDDQDHGLDAWHIGHVQMKGGNVTEGYYNNPEATANVITADGWLRTGDIGFLTDEGYMVITSRAKDIIFVNGQNVYPHDIERVSEELDFIELNKVAAAGVLDEASKEMHIVLFVAFTKGMEQFYPITRELRDHISRRMGLEVKHVLPVRKIPKTTSGKIQRFALTSRMQEGEFEEVLLQLAKQEALERSARGGAAPGSAREAEMLTIWKEVFGRDDIGVEDTFTSLGGNSLQAAMLTAAVQSKWCVEVPIRLLFENTTVAKLTAQMESFASKHRLLLDTAANAENYPLSSAQKGVYAHQAMSASDTSYNVTFALRVDGVLDLERVEQACRELIVRHEALRTVFELVDGQPMQFVIASDCIQIVKVERLQGVPEEWQEMARAFVRPFDPVQAPLWRVGVIESGQGEALLIFDLHHLIVDGTSLALLLKEFFALYQGAEVLPVTLHPKDYAVWERAMFEGGYFEAGARFWGGRFAKLPELLQLPTDFPRPVLRSTAGGRVMAAVEGDIVKGVSALAARLGATPFMVQLGAWQVLLALWSGQKGIAVGTPVAGRSLPELNGVLGMFANTLVLYSQVDVEETFEGFMRRLQDETFAAYEHQTYPFEALVRQLQVPRHPSRHPLFDVMFVLQNMSFPRLTLPDVMFTPYAMNLETSQFDLKLEVFERDGRFDMTLEYAAALFRRETVERLLNTYVALLGQVLEDSNRPLAQYDLVTVEEKQALQKAIKQKRNLTVDFSF